MTTYIYYIAYLLLYVYKYKIVTRLSFVDRSCFSVCLHCSTRRYTQVRGGALRLSLKLEVMRLWRDCRGEARLARRVRRTRIVIIRGIVVIGVRRTRIAHIAIIHSKTSLSVIAGEACLAPTKPCGSKALSYPLCVLTRTLYLEPRTSYLFCPFGARRTQSFAQLLITLLASVSFRNQKLGSSNWKS